MYLPRFLRRWLVSHKYIRPWDLKAVALDYCRTHPEARSSILAAGERLRAEAQLVSSWDGQCYTGLKKPHKFSNGGPHGRCCRCGKTREECGPTYTECEKWQSPSDIEAVIRAEEKKFEQILSRAKKLITPQYAPTGAELFQLYQTHGISPDVVEMLQLRTLPSTVWAKFEAEQAAAAEVSRSKQKKKIVLVAK